MHYRFFVGRDTTTTNNDATPLSPSSSVGGEEEVGKEEGRARERLKGPRVAVKEMPSSSVFDDGDRRRQRLLSVAVS